MRLDDDETYEAFQFWWFALVFARPDKPAPRLETEERLRHKLTAISVAASGGGRVLREPCELQLTPDERVALMERIAETDWTPEAGPHAVGARRLLA